MLTDQWYVRADVLAKPAVEAVENGDIQFVPKQYENMYFSRMRDIGTGVSLVSCGGVTVSRHGTTKRATSTLAAPRKVRQENNLGADVALRQDEDVLDTGSPPRCGLSPPSAGRKTPTRCVSSTPPA